MCKTDDLVAISHLLEDYVAAINAGDAAAVSALFTDNAVIMPNDGSITIGRGAIRLLFDAVFQQFTEKLAIPPGEEIEVVGDWAFDRGSWQATLTPKADGEPVAVSGQGIVIGKRQGDGSWKMARVIYTANKFFGAPPA